MGQPANPGSPGKIVLKMECVCNNYIKWLKSNVHE